MKWWLVSLLLVAGCTPLAQRPQPTSAVYYAAPAMPAPKSEPEIGSEFGPGVSVRSTFVKRIGNMNRYFFHIWNNDTTAFEGEIVISYACDASPDVHLGTERLRVYPKMGGSLYIEKHIGPWYTREYGAYGVRTIAWRAIDGNKQIVAEGKMPVSEKYEAYDTP